MTAADLTFIHRHAEDYAAQSLSYGDLAGEYADWYVAQFGDSDMAYCPDHSNAWPQWLNETVYA